MWAFWVSCSLFTAVREGAASLLWIWSIVPSDVITPVSLAWRVVGGSLKHIVKKKSSLTRSGKKIVYHPLLHLRTDCWLCWLRRELNQENRPEGRGGHWQSWVSSPDFNPRSIIQFYSSPTSVKLPAYFLCFCDKSYSFFKSHCPESTTCLSTYTALTCSVAFPVAPFSEHGLVWLTFLISCTRTISIPKSMLTNLKYSKTFCFPKCPESVQSLKLSDSTRDTHFYPTSKWVYFTLCAKVAFWSYSWLKCNSSSRFLFMILWKTCPAATCSVCFDVSVLCLQYALCCCGFQTKGLVVKQKV